jgi:proteasome lid subunit RPN8/RPN11
MGKKDKKEKDAKKDAKKEVKVPGKSENVEPAFMKDGNKEGRPAETKGPGKKEGKVIIDIEAYWATIAACVRFASAHIPEPDWREFYGLLLGKIEKNKQDIHVTRAVPMTHTKSIGHILKVQFEEEDYVAATIIESEANEKDEFIVGWVHSHPGIKVMFSQDDIKTQLYWQQANSLAVGIVFNQKRLLNQVEVAYKKGDPSTPLQDDPGFEVFRLDDPSKGIQASYHKVAYQFNTDKKMSEIVTMGKVFCEDATQFFPRDDPATRVEEDVQKNIDAINSAVVGVEEYAQTLIRQGEPERIPEVVESQRAEIDQMIEVRNDRIAKQRKLFEYLEYKERESVYPKVKQIFDAWEEAIVAVKPRLDALLQAS